MSSPAIGILRLTSWLAVVLAAGRALAAGAASLAMRVGLAVTVRVTVSVTVCAAPAPIAVLVVRASIVTALLALEI